MESTVETDQRLSKELARYILPSGGDHLPPPPSRPAKEYSNLRLVPDRPTFPFVLVHLRPSPFLSLSPFVWYSIVSFFYLFHSLPFPPHPSPSLSLLRFFRTN